MKTFICSNCNREFPFFLKGGTNKLVANPIKYSDDNETECVYCKGFYPDGTICAGGKKR